MMPSEETRTRLLLKFRSETTNHLITLRRNLPFLVESNNREVINKMFLAAHTIKGNLGMMQLLDENPFLLELNPPAAALETIMWGLQNQETTASTQTVQQIDSQLSQIENQFAISQEI